MKLSAKEKDTIIYAIVLWKNYIETGDVTLSSRDAAQIIKASGDTKPQLGEKRPKIKSLNKSQRDLLQELDRLQEKMRSD